MLTIGLLGGLTIQQNGRSLELSPKAAALLVYLAYEKRPFSREELASFFWDHSNPEQALANLRKLLTELRAQAGDFLLVERHAVSFKQESNYWLDTDQFWQHPKTQPGLETAVSLYHGDFLAGFYLTDNYAFDEWASLERERLRLGVIQALHNLITHYLHHRQYQNGILHANHLVALDPLSEESHRLLMRLLARHGERNAALAHYAACQQLLADELGVDPSPETAEWHHRLRHAPQQPHHFPTFFTPCVGRQSYIATLNRLLDDPTCRLITLVGPGGVGKTRLALETAADHTADFLHGLYFVALDGFTVCPENALQVLVSAVASTLGLTLLDHQPAQSQLLNHLHQKEMLLILDTFEPFTAVIPLVRQLLRHAPALKLLITSRERLNTPEETLLQLEGLAIPSRPITDETATCESVQLFQSRARLVQPDFVISAVSLPSVVHICQLVAGLPLAIELAASAIHALPLEQIADQITYNPDSLPVRTRDLPPRHRNLRAVWGMSEQVNK